MFIKTCYWEDTVMKPKFQETMNNKENIWLPGKFPITSYIYIKESPELNHFSFSFPWVLSFSFARKESTGSWHSHCKQQSQGFCKARLQFLTAKRGRGQQQNLALLILCVTSLHSAISHGGQNHLPWQRNSLTIAPAWVLSRSVVSDSVWPRGL